MGNPRIATETDLAERYARGVERLPINSARPGNSLEGYWIDTSRFYFLAERADPASGRILCTPSVADLADGTVTPAIELEDLAALLTAEFAAPVSVVDLADAGFDMPRPSQLAVSLRGRVVLVDLAQARVESAEALPDHAELYAPNGGLAVFMQGHDLCLRGRRTGETRPLTTDGEEHFAYGRESEASLAVIAYRRRPRPVGLWSQNSEWFVTQRVDERLVPELSLIQHAPPEGGRPVLHTYRYPMPGDPRPLITMVAIHVPSGRTITTASRASPLHIFSDFQTRNLWFSDDGAALYALQLDQHEARAALIEVDLQSGAQREVIAESAPDGYLAFHTLISGQPNVRVLRASSEVVWFSDRDGWGHLYLYDSATGALKTQITRGEWLVRDIVHIDETARKILFLAGGIDPGAEPGQRALCSVSLDGGEVEVVLADAGDVIVIPDLPAGFRQSRPFAPSYAPVGASADGRAIAVRRTAVEIPTRASLVELATGKELQIALAQTPDQPRTPPRPFEAVAADGQTRLFGTLFFPSDFDAEASYPLVDFIYPGPQVANLPRAFGTVKEALAQAAAELGFVTLMMDSRGVPFRSRAFHQAGGGQLLEPQLADHAAVVEQLCERHAFVDRERVGMVGNSGGGYATARALLDYPDVFKVGVSASGNHDSRLYHAAWLEKYAGPKSGGFWDVQANPPRAANLKGKLFLITGDMDDNVHPAQTLGLVNSLIAENKDFDLLVIPNGGHDLWNNRYVQRRIWDYLVTHLMGARPPAGFEIRYADLAVANSAGVRAREMFPA